MRGEREIYLNKLGYCYTTRVYKEIGKYKVGELYTIATFFTANEYKTRLFTYNIKIYCKTLKRVLLYI